MKKEIITLITSALFFIGMFTSCSYENDDCDSFDNQFKINDLNINTFEMTYHDTISNMYDFKRITENDTISFEKLYLELDPVKELFYAQNTTKSFSFISAAYACSPPVPYSLSSIDKIEITCDKDFDNTHKAGEDLSSLFDVMILDLYKNINYHRLDLNDFIVLKPNAKDKLYLILKKAPEKTDTYKFKISYWQTFNHQQSIIRKEIADIIIKK